MSFALISFSQAGIEANATIADVVGDFIDDHDVDKLFVNKEANTRKLSLLKSRIITLLQNHPKPFDQRETIALAADLNIDAIRHIGNYGRTGTVKKRFDELKEELSTWPEELRPSAALWLAIGNEEPKHFADTERNSLGEKLRAIENPLGKGLLCDMMTTPLLSHGMPHLDAQIRAIEVILAVHLFELRYKQCPDSLDELADRKILATVPIDPNGTKPMQYPRIVALCGALAMRVRVQGS